MVNHFLTADDKTACGDYAGTLAEAVSVQSWSLTSCPDCLNADYPHVSMTEIAEREHPMIDANACTCHEQVMILRTGHHDRSCPSFRPARRKTSCAGCDCEPGTTCDTQLRCHYCGHSKTACDAYRSDPDEDRQCCKRCDHRAI